MEPDGDSDLDVQVAVVGDRIVVTMPGTSYSVTYHLGYDPWLIASDNRDDDNSTISKWTFRAKAYVAAHDKARALGWIV